MKTNINYYKDSLLLLNKINEIILNNRNISQMFVYKGYDFWQSYQMLIFQNIKKFIQNKDHKIITKRINLLIIVKYIILNTLLIFISILSIIIIYITRRKVIVYCSDKISSKYKSDFRIEEIYSTLINNKVGFLEIFHTLLDKNVILNFFARRRFSIYIESIDFIFLLLYKLKFIRIHNTTIINYLNLNNFKENDIKFIRNLFSEYLIKFELSKFRIELLSLFLRFTSIKLLLTIDDVRHYNELILACKINNIETYAFQHGHYTKYHVGWLSCKIKNYKIITPDKLIVWSNYWKNELLRLGTYFNKDQIVVGGYKDIIDVNIKNRRKTSQVNILIPYETEAPKDEILANIEEILKYKNINIFFKLRPDIDKKIQLQEYKINDDFHERLFIIEDIKIIINKIDIVAGTYSTFLYDMIKYDKKIVIFKTCLDYGDAMVTNGLADYIYINKHNVYESIIKICRTSSNKMKRKREILYGKKQTLLKDTLYIIAKEHNIL